MDRSRPMVQGLAMNWWTRLAMCVAVGLAGVLWLVLAANAFNPQPDPPGFGLVGITSDETLRFGVVCAAQGVHGFPPGPCRVTLMLVDIAGNMVRSETFNLRPGQGAFHDVMGSEVMSDRSARRVELTPWVIPAPDSGRVIPTVQVFDTMTGKTSAYVVPIPRISFFEPNRGPATMGAPGR